MELLMAVVGEGPPGMLSAHAFRVERVHPSTFVTHSYQKLTTPVT